MNTAGGTGAGGGAAAPDADAGAPGRVVARVVPDVTGLDKHFDYLVPESLVGRVQVGSLVRVMLHGRRVGGWVVEVRPLAVGGQASRPDDPAGVDPARLVEIAKFSSVGPSAPLVELASWAATRWGVARVRPFLGAASPATMVGARGAARRTIVADDRPVWTGLHHLAPLTDPLSIVLDAARRGPTLALHPSPPAARALARRLRATGLTVAVAPDEWAAADAGVDVVVGSRIAAWAPCAGLRAVVVLDEHDEAYQEERSPTWHARDVAVERARRAGASCVLTSPCPSATALHWAGDRVIDAAAVDPSAWPTIEIDDRTDVEPWRRSMIGSRLIELLRDPSRRVACVLNTTGRARLVACRSCRALQRCERCTAAVAVDDAGTFSCARCSTTRPQVCGGCGATAMANVRPGVTRLREELEAAAGRPVALVAADSDSPVTTDSADVFVGTEAVLHRVGGVDTVVFLDLDSELLAPRYRAHEHVLALVVRAARRVGAASRGGVVLVQTHLPDHQVVAALAERDLRAVVSAEVDARAALGLPPFGALAAVEGPGAEAYVAGLHLAAARTAKGYLVRADDWHSLGAALAAAPRPRGSSVRVAVDPPRA